MIIIVFGTFYSVNQYIKKKKNNKHKWIHTLKILAYPLYHLYFLKYNNIVYNFINL